MKKIPSLFERVYENHKIVACLPELSSPELQVVLDGKCVPTLKIDGACCACINGKFYKRYDAKHGKTPPANAIPCCDPDPITGHWPHWIPVENTKADKWFIVAKETYEKTHMFDDGTYEAIGIHFQNNPYELNVDTLYRHGSETLDLGKPTYENIKTYLHDHLIEGIVFWYNNTPLCKIKRSDFGFSWKNTK